MGKERPAKRTFSELGWRATRAPLWVGVTGKFWHLAQEQNPYQPQSSLQPVNSTSWGGTASQEQRSREQGHLCSAAVTGRTHQACTLKGARASEEAVRLSSGLPSLPLSPGRPTSSGSGVQTAWETVSPLQTPATFTRCQLHIL